MMWAVIFSLFIAAAAAGVVYLVSRFYKTHLIDKLSKGNKKIRIAVSTIPVILISATIGLLWGMINAMICLLHLVVFWLLADCILFFVRKLRKKEFRHSYAGIAAVTFTVVYL